MPELVSEHADWPHTAGELVNYVVDRNYGGVRKRLAEQIGLSLSYLGKVAVKEWPIGPETALQLAHLAGLPPDYCLRIAGHEKLLLLIEDAFGGQRTTRTVALDDYQRELLALLAHFKREQQKALIEFLSTIRR